MVKRLLWLVLIILAGGFFFFIDLLGNYLAINHNLREASTLDFPLIFVFFLAVIGAAIATIVRLLRRQNRKAACWFLFVVSAVISFWFRGDLQYLSDRTFLLFNKQRFQDKIEAAGTKSAVALQWEVWADNYKIFLYSSAPLAEGRMSQQIIDSLEDLGELKGCRFYTIHLNDNFYTIFANCR
jgi:hypothetical protein